MKKNSGRALTIASVIVAVLAFAALTYGYWSLKDTVQNVFRLNVYFLYVGLIVFIVLALVCYAKKKNKMIMLVPVLILLVTTSVGLSYVFNAVSSDSESQQTSVLSICATALLVVSLVFALKGKKWAGITAVVLLSLNILSTYTCLSGVASMRTSVATDENDTILYLEHMLIANIATYAALVVYFVNLLVKKAEVKEIEEVSE